MANGTRAAERRRRRAALLAQPRRPRLHRHARSTGSTSRAADHAFLDAAWSHVDELQRRQAGARAQRAVPGGGLEAAARRVHGHDAALRRRPPAAPHAARGALPRGRRALQRRRHPGRGARALRRRLRARPGRRAIAYLDPPYAPPRDDTCYVKRYHFLEGLATYWRGQEIMWETRTRKLRKRHTPFGSKRTVAVRAGPAVRPLPAPRRRWSSPTAPTPTSTRPSSKRCSPATGAACAGSRFRTATRSARIAPPERRAATEYVFVAPT